MEESSKKLNKWELARYLIDAKKCVDSILFIEENKSRLVNIGLRDEVSLLRQRFYINCGVVLDAQFPKREKKTICDKNEIVRAIYYERDKNAAHKDIDYRSKEDETLKAMAEVMKKQITCVRELCSAVLPDVITLDFVAHDKKLFRMIHGITPEIEEQINRIKHPKYGQPLPKDATLLPPRKVLNDTEEIRAMGSDAAKECAVIIDAELNTEEGLQNRQDGCIKINAIHGQNMWATINQSEVEKFKRLKRIRRICARRMSWIKKQFIIRWQTTLTWTLL